MRQAVVLSILSLAGCSSPSKDPRKAAEAYNREAFVKPVDIEPPEIRQYQNELKFTPMVRPIFPVEGAIHN